MVTSTDVCITLDGPVTENSSFIFSVRRSFLQLLFRALSLPLLPTYNNSQFKFNARIGKKDVLTIIGLGALDNKHLNLSANETEEQRYNLGVLPTNDQCSYTVGAKYEHFRNKSFQTVVVSRCHLYNAAKKYEENNENLPLLLNYSSEEIENKVRRENELVSGLNKKRRPGGRR